MGKNITDYTIEEITQFIKANLDAVLLVDAETDTYKTADGYMPVVKYPIRKLEQNMVIYNPIEFEFIEY